MKHLKITITLIVIVTALVAIAWPAPEIRQPEQVANCIEYSRDGSYCFRQPID